ncbi:unnamed protein product [Lota lota]
MSPPSTLSLPLPPLHEPGQPQVIKGGDTGGAAAPHWSTNPPPLPSSVAELTAQARQSLRWEGMLDDPLAEGERLELYKARRRQRYLALRPGLRKMEAPTRPEEDGGPHQA